MRRTTGATRARTRCRWPLAALLALVATLASASPEAPIVVVVGHDTAAVAGTLSAAQVYGVYARRRQLWPDRSPILAVNLPVSHPLRRSFSLWVFHRSPEDLRDYWNDVYFHGILPPAVLASEEAVLRYVAATPGAIGYVSACSVDKRVDVVATITGPDGAAACPR